MDQSRFERINNYLALVGTSKIRNRINLDKTDDFGDFLSRLWALFGPPEEIHYEGFTYTLKDTVTDLVFSAYSAGSGPAYGGHHQNIDELLPILDIFDELLSETILADCEVEFETDFGIYRTGARDGIPFGETINIDE